MIMYTTSDFSFQLPAQMRSLHGTTGVVIGILLAMAVSKGLESSLYGVKPLDLEATRYADFRDAFRYRLPGAYFLEKLLGGK